MAPQDGTSDTALIRTMHGGKGLWRSLLLVAALWAAQGCSSFTENTTTKKSVSPYNSATQAGEATKGQDKSWLSEMFGPSEPEKPRSPTEWIGQKRMDW
jgi:hypothetical protein